ncbi:MAG: hypothetical protein JO123_09210 [Ktedonobacteraceae bacterium]|nr:hypothetical protein [Ktedonobacteraceae bacterium]
MIEQGQFADPSGSAARGAVLHARATLVSDQKEIPLSFCSEVMYVSRVLSSPAEIY